MKKLRDDTQRQEGDIISLLDKSKAVQKCKTLVWGTDRETAKCLINLLKVRIEVVLILGEMITYYVDKVKHAPVEGSPISAGR
jgi:hypothetical protein